MRKATWLLGGWICLALVGCGPPLNKPAQDGKLAVAVSIVPQAWLVKKIGGDHVTVSSLAKPGEDPHTYSPTDAEVSELMRSKVYFRVGVSFERGNWFDAIEKSKTLTMVDFRKGIELREMEEHHHHDHDAHDHDHKDEAKATDDKHDHDHADEKQPAKESKASDPKKESAQHDHDHDHDHDHAHDHHGHEHEAGDPHIWLSPKLLKIQAHTVADALAAADPAHKDDYRANLEAVEKELDALDAEIREMLAPHKGKAFFVFHPAWGYFAEDYGLRQIAIEVKGREPSDHELTEVQNQAKKEGAKVVFVQPQIPGRAAEAVAKVIGGKVDRIDPLSEDVAENLKQVGTAIAKSFE